jgi:hypothetical protein
MMEASVPSEPRNGAYLQVAALADHSGGDPGVRVELEQCKTCAAAVERNAVPDHESWHAAQGGAEPKSR